MSEITYLDPDSNVTETFAHKESRFPDRRIKVLGIIGNHAIRGPIYRYEVVAESEDRLVGRRGRLSRQTLNREYRRVSK